MDTIILTGATGFLGGYLLKDLSKHYRLRCLVRPDSKQDRHSNLEYHEIDFINPIFSDGLFFDVFAVVHLLSIKSSFHPDIWAINVNFTRKLVTESLAHNVQKIVYMSSETVQLVGDDLYTKTKRLAEKEVLKHNNRLILRPTVIYGERDKSNIGLLIGLARRLPVLPILGTGTQLMQPVYAGDVATCIISGLVNDISGTHLIPGQKALQYKEIINVISEAIGKKILLIRVPFSIGYLLAWVFRLLKLSILQKSQVDNLRIHKVYTVDETEKLFRLNLTDPKEGIFRTAK